MPEVTVGESIRAILQPNDNCVKLTDGPDARVMYIEIHDVTSNDQAKRGINSMAERGESPGRLRDLMPVFILLY